MNANGIETLKIVGVGVQRTGTSSLRTAFKKLGYNTMPVWGWLNRFTSTIPYETAVCDSKRLLQKYDAIANVPVTSCYKEIDETFPHARFILTTRKDEEKWLGSLVGFFGGRDWPEIRLVFGVDADFKHRDLIVAKYRQHNEAVRQYFADRPGKLLEMDMTQGQGWPELCKFLSKDLPREKLFPRSNHHRSLRRMVLKRCVPAIVLLRSKVMGAAGSVGSWCLCSDSVSAWQQW